jgi:hypothetical protein
MDGSKQNNGWPWPCTSWCRGPSWAAARLRQHCTILASANRNPLKVPECSTLRGLRSMFWGGQNPGVRHVWAVRVIICLIPGGRGFFGDCWTYIAESGANFWNIVKEPVHGERYVQNCALKKCNCHVFLSLFILRLLWDFYWWAIFDID